MPARTHRIEVDMSPPTSSDAAALASSGHENDVDSQHQHHRQHSASAHSASNSTHAQHSPPHPHPSRDNCDRRRPAEEEHSRLKKMPSALVGKTVSPFLKEHIPGIYAPVGKDFKDQDESSASPQSTIPRDGNTRFCYRHRPDSKCRRTADETKMGMIQRVSSQPHHSVVLVIMQC